MEKLKDFFAYLVLAISLVVGLGILVASAYYSFLDNPKAFYLFTGTILIIILVGWAVNRVTKTKK